MTQLPADVVGFWRAAGPAKWFTKDRGFDADIRSRFEGLHHGAARGEHDEWTGSTEGALGLILLFDQLPRNLWRGSAHAFATDPLARKRAREAIEAGHDQATAPALRPFFYLPFEHSEDAADQALSVELHDTLARAVNDRGVAKWARSHRDIIARFGRFPHRNRCLGRETTIEEQAFLDAGGFAG